MWLRLYNSILLLVILNKNDIINLMCADFYFHNYITFIRFWSVKVREIKLII